MSKLAIVQAPPVFLDRQKTLERTVGYIDQAVSQGAELVVFPSGYFPAQGKPATTKPGGFFIKYSSSTMATSDHLNDCSRSTTINLNESVHQVSSTGNIHLIETSNTTSRISRLLLMCQQ